MDWVISHRSALEYWRQASVGAVHAKKALYGSQRPVRLPTEPLDAKCLLNESQKGLTAPLDILVGSRNARKVNRHIKCHTHFDQKYKDCYIRITPKLAVCSPELCFIQLARELPLVNLIEIGYELCGGYRLDKRNDPERGFRDDLPLTSVAELSVFVKRMKGLKGGAKAKRALRYIADNSNSPRETILTLLLTLPNNLGGYGFSKPVLNHRIDVSHKQGTTSVKPYYSDLFWQEAKVDVEYDSDAYHALPERIAKDAIKKNDLTSVGIKVYTVTKEHIANVDELHIVAEQLSKVLGKRLKLQMPQFATKRKELRRLLQLKAVSDR